MQRRSLIAAKLSRGTRPHTSAPCAPLRTPPSSLAPPLSLPTAYLLVQGTDVLGRLNQLHCRCLVLVLARQPQGRFAVLHVCVCVFVKSCMHVRGGQEAGNRVSEG